MMYLIKDSKQEVQWHVGEKLKLVPWLVNEVQADGDELEWIKSNITGIPFNQNRVQTWFGDTAKFIADSLPK